MTLTSKMQNSYGGRWVTLRAEEQSLDYLHGSDLGFHIGDSRLAQRLF